MLRFEKKRHSKSLGITLRAKKPLWTEEMILAGGIALFFHLAALFLFSINTFHWNNFPSLASVQVSADRLSRPLDLNLAASESSLAPPPKPPSPIFPLEAELPISFVGPKKFKSIGFVRGPYPEELTLPHFPSQTVEYARISIRSDPKGEVFWFAWLEKTNQDSINRLL